MLKKIGLLIIIIISIHLAIINFFKIEYLQDIEELSVKYDVNKELILSIIKVESNFKAKIVSYKGAVGLMQVMPSTANWILKKAGKNPQRYNLYNVRDNLEIGMLYYAYLSRKFDGNITKVIIAYNAGASRVYDESWKEIKETRHYVYKIKISRFFYKYRLLTEKIKNKF